MVFFIFFIISLKPIVIIPGLFGNQLEATFNYQQKHFYCSSSKKSFSLTANLRYFVPPFFNCLFDWMMPIFNQTTNRFEDPLYKNVTVFDFGGEKSTECQISNIFCFDVYRSMIRHFRQFGYQVKKNLFFAPQDWRFGYIGKNNFYPNLKALVEQAFQINQEKVVLISHSAGIVNVQTFLIHFVEIEWISKYLDFQIFIAPALGGWAEPISCYIGSEFSDFSSLLKDKFEYFCQNFPFLYQSLPREEVYSNHTVLIDEKGKHYNSTSVREYLAQKDRLFNAKYQAALPYFKLDNFSRLLTKVVFNSQIETVVGFRLNWTNGKDRFLFGEGDGTIPTYFEEQFCSFLECVDIHNSKVVHNRLIVHQEVLKIL